MAKLTKEQYQEQVSKLLPNTFPFPNLIIDFHESIGRSIWSVLVGPEQNLLTVLYRKTFGWWKERDRISTSQLIDFSGLSEATVRKYMQSLCDFGLAIKLSDGSDGHPILWEVQTDDSLINFDALIERRSKMDEINKTRWNNGRQNIGVMSDNTPIVGHDGGGIVGHDGGGIVGQQPQKPLSKTTKQKPKISGQKKPARTSDKMPDKFPAGVDSLAMTFIRETGLVCETKPDYIMWVYGNSKSGAKGFDFMKKHGIIADDLVIAIGNCKKNKLTIKNPNSIYPMAHEAMMKRIGNISETSSDDIDPDFVKRLNGG